MNLNQNPRENFERSMALEYAVTQMNLIIEKLLKGKRMYMAFVALVYSVLAALPSFLLEVIGTLRANSLITENFGHLTQPMQQLDMNEWLRAELELEALLAADSLWIQVADILILLLWSMPLSFGFIYLCTNVVRRKEVKLSQLFYGFSRRYIWKIIGVELLIAAAIGIPVILSLVLGGLLLSPLIVVMPIILMIPIGIFVVSSIQSLRILLDFPHVSPVDCISESMFIMKGNKATYVKLLMNFLGVVLLAAAPVIVFRLYWGFYSDGAGSILSVTFAESWIGIQNRILFASVAEWVFSVGRLWVVPMLGVAYSLFYDFLVGNSVYNENGEFTVIEKPSRPPVGVRTHDAQEGHADEYRDL